MEQWLVIPDHECYEVSNLGNIRVLISRHSRYPKGYYLKGTVNKDGYVQLVLTTNKKKHNLLGHILVMSAFVGRCPTGKEVNHINGIKTDNRLGNLEYLTRQGNAIHSVNVLGNQHGKLGQDHPSAKLYDNDIIEIRRLFSTGFFSALKGDLQLLCFPV